MRLKSSMKPAVARFYNKSFLDTLFKNDFTGSCGYQGLAKMHGDEKFRNLCKKPSKSELNR